MVGKTGSGKSRTWRGVVAGSGTGESSVDRGVSLRGDGDGDGRWGVGAGVGLAGFTAWRKLVKHAGGGAGALAKRRGEVRPGMRRLASSSCAAAMEVSMGFSCGVPWRRAAAAAAAGLTFLGERREGGLKGGGLSFSFCTCAAATYTPPSTPFAPR
jgi:hypothetical protein